MQPSPSDAPLPMPQNGTAPMQPAPMPANFAMPYQQAAYTYPQAAQAYPAMPVAAPGMPVAAPGMPMAPYGQNLQPATARVTSMRSEDEIREASGGHNKKVIQPLHDIDFERQRTEMQRKMAELLGEPVENIVKPDEHANQEAMPTHMSMTAIEKKPAPAMPYSPLPHITAPTQYPQGQPNPYAQQQAAYRQNIDPQIAASMQLQALRAEEMRRAQFAQAAGARQLASQQAQAQYQQQMRNYASINPLMAQRVANAVATPKSQAQAQAASQDASTQQEAQTEDSGSKESYTVLNVKHE